MRRGAILLATLAVLAALAGLALVFGGAMRVEAMAAANNTAALQADAIARGAMAYVMARLAEAPGTIPPDEELDAEAVTLGGGHFWLLKPDYEDDRTMAFGLIDESSKLNLNSATEEMLAKLPGSNNDLAASIVAWRGAGDEDARAAEDAYYLSLAQPYTSKSAPFETVGELLLVKDVTVDVLRGEDANGNGILDDNEDNASVSGPEDNRNGRLERGFEPFVTVYSVEGNRAADGTTRANVNQVDQSRLREVLQNAVGGRLEEILRLARENRPFANIIEFYYDTQMTAAEFRLVADRLTTSTQTTIRGLVNVNTAPKQVLACLPGLDEADADALVSKRKSESTLSDSIAWVVEALPREKAIGIGNWITARSSRCMADIVAVAPHGRAFKRYQVIIDTRQTPMRVIYCRDLTDLGWPLDMQILADLRAGQALDGMGSTLRAGGLF